MVVPGHPMMENIPDPHLLSLQSVIAIYEALRETMPIPATEGHCTYSKRLIDLLNEFDGLILDGSGVINVGNDPIDGIKELLLAAKTKCKPIVVLSNAASFPNSRNLKKYQQWGLPLTKFQLISSRDVISEHFKKMLSPKSTNNCPPKVGFLGTFVKPLSIDGSLLYGQDHDFWDRADVFVFLGALEWKESDQMALEKAMIERPRPIHVANPDVAAPQPEGRFSAEPGYWTFRAIQKLSRERILGNIFWYGKPHKQAFSFALSKIEALAGKSIRPGNICMVGDTLHTDILGGMAGGFKTALLRNFGLFRDVDVYEFIEKCDIWPDWVVDNL